MLANRISEIERSWPFWLVRTIIRVPGVIGLFGGIAMAVRLLDPRQRLPVFTAPAWIGGSLAILGLLFVLVAAEVLTQGGGTRSFWLPQRASSVTGPYRYL